LSSLVSKAWLSLAVLGVVMGLLLFVPAGTIRYWQAWVYLAIFLGGAATTTLFLARRDPALLERRLKGGPIAEKRPAQRLVMVFTSLGFVAILVVPALDYRYHWSRAPFALVFAGDVLVAAGMALIVRVYRENTYASATIEVAKDQTVISTGPYAIVRHPMYASASLYLVGTPLSLGSYWGLLPFAVILPFLIWRLRDEEKMLTESLPGYAEYQRTVRHRLVPGIW
jgi:protein-S-isoprenylcysteine O-methyltransferase Ste14